MTKQRFTSRETTLDRVVRQADPEFDAERRRQPEYEFTRRTFLADPARRFPNTYEPPET